MFEQKDIARLRAMVENHLHISLPRQLTVEKAAGLCVSYADGTAHIAAEDRNALTRGLFLLGCAVADGQDRLEVSQQRHIASCGVMLDCSRNAVPTLEGAKRFIDRLALLGMNLLLLYTEDTYEVPTQPYLGYLRGRFTQAELRELDDYAAAYDIELMPCIQTLGHMTQFLQWDANWALRDRTDILLAGEEKVYQFLREAIGSLRRCMRAKRIHIGMDEAHDVGLGRYKELHGFGDRMEILRTHLEKVVGICQEFDFRPIMWSDMFFRLGSANGEYFDRSIIISEELAASLPPVDMCYWDYYHRDEDFYDHMLTQHKKMGPTTFAGGMWVWSGFLPHMKRTAATMRPALRVAARHKVDTVFATMWGDDGAETSAFLALNQLPLFSESCWQGPDCADEDIARLGEKVTGVAHEAFTAFGEWYPGHREECTGKAYIWADPLYPLTNYGFETPEEALPRFTAAGEVLSRYDQLETNYARQLFLTAIAKGEWIRDLRPAYLAGDREYLTRAAEELIPRLQEMYRRLMKLHRQLWERDMRRNGWEVICLRYGGQLARLEDVQDELRRYLSGELTSIVELDEEPLPAGRVWGQHYAAFAMPGRNDW
ncbi:MAG: beta-N-acetylhexosaminidase [Clostridiales bacterium]|nr:beta-N-acetylhexosaminidase [Clostridiales bacterium]